MLRGIFKVRPDPALGTQEDCHDHYLEGTWSYAWSKKANSELLEKVFQDFNIEIQVVDVKLGPVVTLFEIIPAAGIKINTIINLADDISRSMGVGAVRISQIYGTQYLGVEVPNEQRETVTIKPLTNSTQHKIIKTSKKK